MTLPGVLVSGADTNIFEAPQLQYYRIAVPNRCPMP
jgi:hypothetical protein